MHVLTIYFKHSGCSIWAVELIKREILNAHPDANVNAVLLDFFLYDLAKEREAQGMSVHALSNRNFTTPWTSSCCCYTNTA